MSTPPTPTAALMQEIEGLLAKLDGKYIDAANITQHELDQLADALRRADADVSRLDWLCSKVYSFQVGLDGPIIDANREAIDQARREGGAT